MSKIDSQFIEVQPNLINFYLDFPVYIIHPTEKHLVRFVPRKEVYTTRAIETLVSKGIKVYVKLSDHKSRSSILEKRLVEYLRGPYDEKKVLVIRDITVQLVNEVFAGGMGADEESGIDAKTLSTLERLAGYYVGLLDLDDAEDLLKVLRKAIVKDLSIPSHSISLMILAVRFRAMERARLLSDISMPKSLITNVSELEEREMEKDKRWALGALLHDIGKINLPEKILRARRRLNDDEAKLMKSHVNMGFQIVKMAGIRFSGDETVKSSILFHHERIDGSGYPLRMTSFNQVGQIMGLLDAYDNLTTDRSPFHRESTPFEALKMLKEETQSGKFDPALFTKLVELVAND